MNEHTSKRTSVPGTTYLRYYSISDSVVASLDIATSL